MTTVAHPPPKGYRTIRLPLSEHEYKRFLSDRPYAKARLQDLYADYPAVPGYGEQVPRASLSS